MSAAVQIRDILETVWFERSLLESGQDLYDGAIEIALRGPAVGAGTAPLIAVKNLIDDIYPLLYRVTELESGFPFKASGRKPYEIRSLCQPLMTVPQMRNFHFGIRLARPAGTSTYDSDGALIVSRILPTFFAIVQDIALASDVTELSDRLNETIQEPDYRKSILKHAKNIVPDGQEVEEIEFTLSESRIVSRTTLFSDSRTHIENLLGIGGTG